MEYYDYERIAREAGISPGDLERLCGLIRRDFPHDDMMYELHVMRACRIVRDGPYTLEQIIQDYAPASTAAP